MNSRKVLGRLSLALAWILVVVQGPEISRATCGEQVNNQGPYAWSMYCNDDPSCDDYGEDLACQEENCMNCLRQKTGYSTFCVSSYDCYIQPGCYETHCT